MNKKGAGVILYTKEKDGSIKTLLGKRLFNPGKNCWGVPGGRMEDIDNGSFENTAVRECFEETGIMIEKPLKELEQLEFPNCSWITYIKEISINEKKLFRDEVETSNWFELNNLPFPLVNLIEEQIIKLKNILEY